jgi:hypothetical protein
MSAMCRLIKTRLGLAVCILFVCVSCDSNAPRTSVVKGVVELDGKPLAGFDKGSVVLTPVGGRLAVGPINPNSGTFELHTYDSGDGAIVGPAKLAVIAVRLTNGSADDDRHAGGKSILPEHFSDRDNSGLECEVKAGDANFFRIMLTKDGKGKIETQ